MKANELMIGDWVRQKEGLCANCVLQLEEVHELEFAYNYEPIPLTPEILEKNRFEYEEEEDEWWHYDSYPFSDFQIGYEGDDDMRVSFNSSTTNIKLNYVHELQHALRLCGLNDLADNFKID